MGARAEPDRITRGGGIDRVLNSRGFVAPGRQNGVDRALVVRCRRWGKREGLGERSAPSGRRGRNTDAEATWSACDYAVRLQGRIDPVRRLPCRSRHHLEARRIRSANCVRRRHSWPIGNLTDESVAVITWGSSEDRVAEIDRSDRRGATSTPAFFQCKGLPRRGSNCPDQEKSIN